MRLVLALLGILLPWLAYGATDVRAIPLLSIPNTNWTSEESAYLRQLHQRGSIKIATKISSAVYMPEADGSNSGFHYNVLKEFALLANIEVEVRLVPWSEYF